MAVRSTVGTAALIAVALAGCPAPASPPAAVREPPPPARTAPPAPAPKPPGLVYFRLHGAERELVAASPYGERARVLTRLSGSLGQAVDVDVTSGRWVVVTEARSIDDRATTAPRGVATLVFGSIAGGAERVVAGDRRCVAHHCFEQDPRLAPGGEELIVTQLRSGGSQPVAYAFGGGVPHPLLSGIAGTSKRGVQRPVVSADHARLAYVDRGKLYLVERDQPSMHARMVAALPGWRDAPMVLAGDSLVFQHDIRAEIGGTALATIHLPTGTIRSLHALPAFEARKGRSSQAPLWRASAGEVIVLEATGPGPEDGRVVAVAIDGSGSRLVLAGVTTIDDLSPDGRWLLTQSGEGDSHQVAVVDLTIDHGARWWQLEVLHGSRMRFAAVP